MKFVYTGGQYTTFRGYVFAHGKPVTVLDRGTILALQRNPNFKEVPDEQEEVKAPATPALLKRPILSVKGRK